MVDSFSDEQVLEEIRNRGLYIVVKVNKEKRGGKTYTKEFLCLKMKTIEFDSDYPDRPWKVTLEKHPSESRSRVQQLTLNNLWNFMGALANDHFFLNRRAKKGFKVAMVSEMREPSTVKATGPQIYLKIYGVNNAEKKNEFVHMYGSYSTLSGILWPANEAFQRRLRKDCADQFGAMKQGWKVWEDDQLQKPESIKIWNNEQSPYDETRPAIRYGEAWKSMAGLRLPSNEDALLYGGGDVDAVKVNVVRRLDQGKDRWGEWLQSAPRKHPLYSQLQLREFYTESTGGLDREDVETTLEDDERKDVNEVVKEIFGDEASPMELSSLIIRGEGIKDREVIGWSTRQQRWNERSACYNNTLMRHVKENVEALVEKNGDEGGVAPHDEAVTLLFKHKIYQKAEMRTLSSFVGSRVHQILAWNRYSQDSAWNMCFPDKESQKDDYDQFERYMTEVQGQSNGLGFLDTAVHAYVGAVEKALTDLKWTVVGVEIPVVDSLRLFLRDQQYQWMESRVDALCIQDDGKLVLVDYKNKIGFKTQGDGAKPDDWHQVFTYAMLMALNYGIVVDSVAVIVAKRNRTVDVQRCPFFRPKAQPTRASRGVKAAPLHQTRVRRYMEGLWFPERDDQYWYIDDRFVANTNGIETLKTGVRNFRKYSHLYLFRVIDAIESRSTNINDAAETIAQYNWRDSVRELNFHRIGGKKSGLYTIDPPTEAGQGGAIPEFIGAFDSVEVGLERLRIDQVGSRTRIRGDEDYEGSWRQRLNNAVWEVAEDLKDLVGSWEPIELAEELVYVAGNAMEVRPNGPIDQENMTALLCRTLNRLVNKRLFDDLVRLARFDGEDHLERAGMRLFEHVSQRALWTDDQLQYAESEYLVSCRNELRVALLNCISANE